MTPKPDPRTLARSIAKNCVALRARRFDRLVSRLYDETLRDQDLRATQLSLLSAVILLGPVAPSELGQQLELEKSTVSRNVRRMVERGWLRIENPAPGNNQRVSVTAKGNACLRAAWPAWQRAQRHALARLGANAPSRLDAMIDELRSD